MKEEKEKSIKHFNSTAGEYDSSFDGKFVKVMYQPLLDELDKNVEGKLLDVGCGTGNILCKLVNGKRELFGIDLSENMVRECSKRIGSYADIKIADAEHITYKDNISVAFPEAFNNITTGIKYIITYIMPGNGIVLLSGA